MFKRTKDKKKENHCMYCGEEIHGVGENPTDFIHYSNADVCGKKFVCPFCDNVITQVNRRFSIAVDAKKIGNWKKVIDKLEQAKDILEHQITEIQNSEKRKGKNVL